MLPLAGHTCWPLKANASAGEGPEPPSWHPAAGRSQLRSPAETFSLCNLQYCTPKKNSEATAASPTLTEPSRQSHNQTLAVPWHWQEALPPNAGLQVGRGECSRYQHEVLTTLPPGPFQPLSFSRIPTSSQTLPSPAPGPQLTQDSLTLSTSHAHHVSIQSTTPLKPHLTPSALSPHLPFPSLQLNKGTVTITVPRGRPARCPLSATDLFPTDRRGPPRAAPPPSRSSCMFDGPACINCNFVRRVTVRWFHRALAIVIIYWLLVMYLLVTKC